MILLKLKKNLTVVLIILIIINFTLTESVIAKKFNKSYFGIEGTRVGKMLIASIVL